MKNLRLILKTSLVMALAGVLITASVSAPTFSWFDRPKSNDGKSMSFKIPYGDTDPNNNSLTMKGYDASNLTMQSFLSTDDAISFSGTAAEPAKSGSLAPGKRIYYKTTISNSGSTDQRVSLYIKDFAPTQISGTNVCVGVNSPIKAFKNYSKYQVAEATDTKNLVSGITKRVYFDSIGKVPSGDSYNLHRAAWFNNNKKIWVKLGNDVNSKVDESIQMTQIENSTVFYADIPNKYNQLYFSNADVPSNSQRTQAFTDLNGDGLKMNYSLLFFTTGSYSNEDIAWAGKTEGNNNKIIGASFASYYNSVSVTAGNEISVKLTSTNYCGSSISYSSDNNGVFTVDGNGTINAVAEGTAKLTYTIKDQYGLSVIKTADVKVTKAFEKGDAIKSAPIVTNLTVPANGSVDVWWFIQNGDDMYEKSTATASYTLDKIYLGV